MIMDKNPNPTKDQHFMIDSGMLQLIYDTAGILEGESIVEIGGGEGALTDYLVQGNHFVTVIEKDPYYAKLLQAKYASYPNVQVIMGDALTFDFSSFDRIVANLPYTITEPFLINLASSGALDYNPNNAKASNLKSITLVLSQNSTRKMVAPLQITEGNSRHINQEFGIMGAICKTFCDVEIVRAIPSEAFYPEPAVTSFVVNLTPKKERTTVDRIMRELLIDKKGMHSTIKKSYQLLLTRGEIYKANKHKGNTNSLFNGRFTSSTIENKNIYDLNHAQISQLVQDLIRNDVRIKSQRTSQRKENLNDYTNYFVGNHFVYHSDFEYEDEDDYEYEYDDVLEGQKLKFQKKYDYMFDSTQYNVLLHRGLEKVDPEELNVMLGSSYANHLSLK